MKSTDREIRIRVPEDILLATSFNETQLVAEMLETLAYKLFSQGRLSGVERRPSWRECHAYSFC